MYVEMYYVTCSISHVTVTCTCMFSVQYSELINSEVGLMRRDSTVSSEGVASSRRDSIISFDSQDKLSTTFVQEVEPGSMADTAGLKAGFVVHMIDEESILRSSVSEVQQIIEKW